MLPVNVRILPTNQPGSVLCTLCVFNSSHQGKLTFFFLFQSDPEVRENPESMLTQYNPAEAEADLLPFGSK